MQNKIVFIGKNSQEHAYFHDLCKRENYTSQQFLNVDVSLKFMQQYYPQIFVVIFDISQTELEYNLNAIKQLKQLYPDILLIVQCNAKQLDEYDQYQNIGCDDFFIPPLSVARLKTFLRRSLDHKQYSASSRKPSLGNLQQTSRKLDNYITNSISMRNTIQKARDYAKRNYNLLIYGEKHVGKLELAQAIHYEENGTNPKAKLIYFHCNEISEAIFQQLQANEFKYNTTIILDEISCLNNNIQHILPQLHTKNNLKIYTLTSVDLSVLVRSGEFDAHLFDILNTHTLLVPSLRHRIEDLGDLSRSEILRFKDLYKIETKDISAEAIKLLSLKMWSKNLIEFRQILLKACLNSNSRVLNVDDLVFATKDLTQWDFYQKPKNDDQWSSNLVHQREEKQPKVNTNLVHTHKIKCDALQLSPFIGKAITCDGIKNKYLQPEPSSVTQDKKGEIISLVSDEGCIKPFQQLEEEIYKKTLVLANGNISKASKSLGVGRATFYRKTTYTQDSL